MTNRITHITSLVNQADGIEISITRQNGYYSVTLIDIDANETLPMSVRFAEYGPALAYATRCAAAWAERST